MAARGDALDFLDLVRRDCDAAGLKRRVKAGGMGAGHVGIVDITEKRFSVDTSDPDWLLVCAHEYAHLCQAMAGKFRFGDDKHDPDGLFDDWLEGKKKLTKRKVTSIVREIQRCELDAERRVVRLVKRYGLTNNVVPYIKKANALILFYEYARRHRRWYVNEPTDVPEILARIPDRLIPVSAIGHLDRVLEALFTAHCC